MIRGKSIAFAIPHDICTFFVAVVGAGANPPIAPMNGAMTPTTPTFPSQAQGLSSGTAPTRTSAGIYVITYSHQLVHVIPTGAAVISCGVSPTAQLHADITVINAATRQVTVKITAPSGTLTDLGTSDMLILTLTGIDSSLT